MPDEYASPSPSPGGSGVGVVGTKVSKCFCWLPTCAGLERCGDAECGAERCAADAARNSLVGARLKSRRTPPSSSSMSDQTPRHKQKAPEVRSVATETQAVPSLP